MHKTKSLRIDTSCLLLLSLGLICYTAMADKLLVFFFFIITIIIQLEHFGGFNTKS